jgi:O-antigen ligase
MVWTQVVYLTIPSDIFTLDTDEPIVLTANPVTRAIKFAMFAISLIILAMNFAVTVRLLRQVNRFFLALLALAAVSYVWSISPDDTAARCLSVLSIVSVCAAFCVVGWHPQRFQAVLRPIITLILLGSIVFGLVSPDLAIEHGEGTLENAWHGLTYQKNYFGQLGTFGVILWMHAGLSGQAKRISAILGLSLSVACVLLARSSTSMMAAVAVAALLLSMLRPPSGLKPYMPYVIGAMFGLVLLYGLAVLNLVPGSAMLLEPISYITGKDVSFSNRTEIWRIVKEHIAFSPYLGSGYGAYWVGALPTSPSFVFMALMNFYPTESHNGYLEVVNDLGFVGLILLVGMIAQYLVQALRLGRFNRPQSALLLAILFQQAIVNLSESCWVVVTSGFIFGIVTLAMFALGRASLDGPSSALRPQPVGARALAATFKRARRN